MNILIVEPEINGHHIVMYVRFLVRGLVKKKINFSILTSKKIKKHNSFDILKKEKKKIKFYFLDDLKYPKQKNPISLLFFQMSNYFKIKKKFEFINRKEKFDYIFLTTLDHIDKVVPFFGSPFGKNKFSSIILNPKNHLNKYKLAQFNFKKFIYDFTIEKILKLNTLEYLYSNDPLFTQYVKKKYLKYQKKIFYFNEPVEIYSSENKKKIKKKFSFKTTDFIILVYGAIKNSKSVTDLIAILNNRTLNKNIKVILSGQQTEEIKKFLKNKVCLNLIKQKKIIVINKFLNLKEEAKVFGASDLIWLVYKNSSLGSSGILFQAKKAKIPIITSKFGIPYWFNRKYNLGPSVDLKQNKNIIKILNNLSSNKKFYNKYKMNISKIGNNDYVKKFYLTILKNLNFTKYKNKKN